MIIHKLDILKESAVIDNETYRYIVNAIDYLKEQGIISAETTSAEPFLLHLAIATMRQKDAENIIAPLDEIALEEVLNSPQFSRAKELWVALEALSPCVFRVEEIDYFYAHLCTLIQ